MSEHLLPDDLTRWPTDPYELLDVTRETSARDIKRAYTKLLRRYKPEQFPEQFRRIRDAYETLLRYAEWFHPGEVTKPSEVSSDSPVTKELAEEPAAAQPREREVEPTLDDYWQRACAGEEVQAYAALRRIQERRLGDEDVYVRLYWLLWARPDLDKERRAGDWLQEGLRQTLRPGSLLHLLQEDLEEYPEAAFGESYARLLDLGLPSGLLSNLLEARWLAADRLYKLAQCQGDLESFRGRFLSDNEELWLRLMVDLAARLVCAEPGSDGEFFDACVEECMRSRHLSLKLAYLFDRLDVLCDMRKQWHRMYLHAVPEPLLRLLRFGPNRSFEEIRPLLEEVLALICESPTKWLRYFDLIAKTVPGALASFETVLEELGYRSRSEPSDERDAQTLTTLAHTFLRARRRQAYVSFRMPLLVFCLRKALSPERMAEVTGEVVANWPEPGSSLADALLHDWSLRYVFRACSVFWR